MAAIGESRAAQLVAGLRGLDMRSTRSPRPTTGTFHDKPFTTMESDQ
jgi:hypothetical protein